ncbi:PAS domain S-box protein [Aquisalimonas sp.]|uniref:PAS domain-containing protein n=1 Tax=Aquisalimonas sp. TaxID=1872621 RepID=UPI0025C25154|nr:PAS domain S-box protein [Aquisalimonas sp.]
MKEQDNPLASPLFKAAADLAFDSVMVSRATDTHSGSEIVYVNDRFTELTGYQADEVMGKTPGLLQGPDTEKTVTDRLAEDLRNGRTFHGQTVNYRKDGSPFDIEWKVTPVVSDGQTTYYLAVQRDVSDR